MKFGKLFPEYHIRFMNKMKKIQSSNPFIANLLILVYYLEQYSKKKKNNINLFRCNFKKINKWKSLAIVK